MASGFCVGGCEPGRTGPVKGYYVLVWLTAWEPQGCINYSDSSYSSCACTLCRLCSSLHFIFLSFVQACLLFVFDALWCLYKSVDSRSMNPITDGNIQVFAYKNATL
jgi:hypothetical protein